MTRPSAWLSSVTSGVNSKPDPVPTPESPPPGPHGCCAEYGQIIGCDGVTDEWYCPLCESTFTQPCPEAELLPIAAGEPS